VLAQLYETCEMVKQESPRAEPKARLNSTEWTRATAIAAT
jgi:hypothetical protein